MVIWTTFFLIQMSCTVDGCSCVLCPTSPPASPTGHGNVKFVFCELFPPALATINKLYRYLTARQRDLCVKLPGINHLCCKLGRVSRVRWRKAQPKNLHKNKHPVFSSGHPYFMSLTPRAIDTYRALNRTDTERFNYLYGGGFGEPVFQTGEQRTAGR